MMMYGNVQNVHLLLLLVFKYMITSAFGFTLQSSGLTKISYHEYGSHLQQALMNLESFDKGSQLFLRFSPLVGGPNIPLHVEVMILNTLCPIYQNASEQQTASFEILHRFDFLPKAPTENSTIMKLMTLNSVPGVLRHRRFISDNVNLCSEENFGTSDDGQIQTFQVPSSRIDNILKRDKQSMITSDDDDYGTNNVDSKDSPFSIVLQISNDDQLLLDEYGGAKYFPCKKPQLVKEIMDEREGMDLHLLQNNCYSYAWDIMVALQKNK